ncbi:hypothetical protein TA3x_002261 [Tundrisphaera sp. TA3]|uniref:hypothetical protein n=1 Tax=Tundrisphaera sp. TA3 TaxID=3435775 RepID=UPI003EC03AAB
MRIAILAIRRWCGGLTLSPPEPVPGLVSPGLWAWLAGLGALLTVAAALQGPGRAFLQMIDLAGLARLLSDAVERLRKAARMVVAVVAMTVVTWTAGQAVSYNKPQGLDEVRLLTRGYSRVDVALGQGVLAAVTPLRDIQALGMMIPVLAAAVIILFRFNFDSWGTGIRPPREIRERASRWSMLGWAGTAVYLLYYRVIAAMAGQGGMPVGGWLVVEVVVAPALMALATGVVLAWVLAELRGVGVDGSSGEAMDVLGSVLLFPAAILASLLTFPAAYLAMSTLLVSAYAPPDTAVGKALAPSIRWALGWGLAEIQAFGLAWVGLLGAVAWSRGTPLDSLRGYARMLAAEGGRLVALVAAAGLAAWAGSALAYLVMLALPASTWVLAAADSYAHYATLPIGLVLLSALVELGERSLPMAELADAAAPPEDGGDGPG